MIFYYKVVAHDKFMLAKLTKNVSRGVNSTNFKNPMWLYCKIEAPRGQFTNDPNPRG
jgi:hypothetical protein